MDRRSLLALLGAAGLAGSGLGRPALAQGGGYPSQPVRLVVPYAAGGPTDVPARLFAEEVSKVWSQRVIVDNRDPDTKLYRVGIEADFIDNR